ncbi:MAG: oligosaccharide flippase family protein [Calditrichaeota bacterium]|nr:oligosaccharide flippase family protein [Calditrichota bacterium]
MKFQFSRSIRDLSRYLLSGGVTRILPFFLLPYIAHILTAEEFGLYTLYRLYITLGSTLILAGVEQGLFRLIPEYPPADRIRFLNNAFLFVLTFVILIVIVTFPVDAVLNALLFERSITFPFYLLPALIGVNAVTTLIITFFSAQRQSGSYLKSNLIAQGSFFILFLIGLMAGLGLKSFFYAFFLSNGILFVSSFSLWKKVLRPKISLPDLTLLFRTGFPLMLVTLISYLLYQSDHYVIKFYLGLEITGIYNYGYRFAAMIMIFVVHTNYVWFPRVYELGEDFFKRNLKSYSSLIIISCAGIFWALVLLFHYLPSIMIPAGFEISKQILTVVGIGYIIYGHAQMMDSWLILKNKSKILVLISSLALVFNVGFNLWLIPKFGLIAAAAVTTVSFLLIWIVLLFYLKNFIENAILLNIFLKMFYFILPCFFLFTAIPVWIPFLFFVLTALIELRTNPLLPRLIRRS